MALMICLKTKSNISLKENGYGILQFSHPDSTVCIEAIYATRKNYLEVCEIHNKPMTPVYASSKEREQHISYFFCIRCVLNTKPSEWKEKKRIHIYGEKEVEKVLNEYGEKVLKEVENEQNI